MKELIFAADDEFVVKTLIERVLKKANYEVATFESGQALIDECTKIIPSLILLDIQMPGLSGLETLEALKKDPRVKDVPVIMLTAKSTPEAVITAGNLGASDYILKPFDHGDLIKRLLLYTYQMSSEEIRFYLSMCNVHDNLMLTKPGLRRFRWQGIDCYPVSFQHFPLCLLMKTGVLPAAIAKRSDETLQSTVRAYAKGGLKWVPIWPIHKEVNQTPEEVNSSRLNQEDVDNLVKEFNGEKDVA